LPQESVYEQKRNILAKFQSLSLENNIEVRNDENGCKLLTRKIIGLISAQVGYFNSLPGLTNDVYSISNILDIFIN
jgi:hypothetical protein